MYVPKHFAMTDTREINRFIAANGFGQLVASVEDQLWATHLPLLHDPAAGLLRGHIARGNPQWRALDGQQVLVILAGPHGYISPGWYTDPGVPTWNYQAVHIRGTVRCLHDEESLQAIVTGLTQQYEAGLESPWVPDFDRDKLRGIVGIEVAIEELQCKYKLSQNRSAAERAEIVRRLDAAGNHSLASAMDK